MRRSSAIAAGLIVALATSVSHAALHAGSPMRVATARIVLPARLGPGRHDAAGRVPCSTGRPALDQTCTYRLVRHGASVEIWLKDAAARDTMSYRVLTYTGQRFSDRDRLPLQVRRQGTAWLVALDGHASFYLIADALLGTPRAQTSSVAVAAAGATQ